MLYYFDYLITNHENRKATHNNHYWISCKHYSRNSFLHPYRNFSNISTSEKDSIRKYYNQYQLYLNKSPELSLSFANKIFKVGEDINNQEVEAFGLLKSGVVLTHLHNYAEASMNLSMSIEKYHQLEDESAMAEAKNMKALVYKGQEKYDDAIALVNDAKTIVS